jgi:hypothetical protein
MSEGRPGNGAGIRLPPPVGSCPDWGAIMFPGSRGHWLRLDNLPPICVTRLGRGADRGICRSSCLLGRHRFAHGVLGDNVTEKLRRGIGDIHAHSHIIARESNGDPFDVIYR